MAESPTTWLNAAREMIRKLPYRNVVVCSSGGLDMNCALNIIVI